jgi:U2 small nuclear ribonucleoprotein A'
LDYQRIRQVEREQAKELFGTQEEPSELAAKIRGVKSKTVDASSGGAKAPTAGKAMRTQLTESEKKRVQEMIQNARSLAEISRIEKDLAEGRIPQGAADADRMVS